MKLTANFALEEFTKTAFDDLSAQQKTMLIALSSTMQVIRDVIKEPIRVTSGMRDLSDYNRLVAKGYFPSDTSDHFFGVEVPIVKEAKKAIYGKTYSMSVGACDFTVSNNDKAFKLIMGLKLPIGQLIHEYGNGKDWIHISNSPTLIYSDSICKKYLTRPKYMISSDAGKTYHEYNVN